MYSEKSVCFYAFRVDRTEKSIEVLSELKGGGGSGDTYSTAFLSMGVPLSRESRVLTGPDSVMVRAFASEAGGAGSNPGRVIPKTLKMVPVATLLGAQHL